MRAGGIAPGSLNTTHFDPVRVAPAMLKCDPYRVGCYSGPVTVGAAHGYHILPLQGKDCFSDSL